jgi:hypothetical protein
MIKPPKIEAFILVNYKKPIDAMKFYDGAPEDAMHYLEMQDRMLQQMIFQINYWYPKTEIHLITNRDVAPGGTTIHRLPIANNHTAKFQVFGLLDKPAMYLDCDIVIRKKFPVDALWSNTPFRMYGVTRRFNLQSISPKPIGVDAFNQYNSGILWIPEPDKKITDDIMSIHNEFFSNPEFIVSKKEWPLSDEYALSVYVTQNGWQFHHKNGIGESPPAAADCQSVHYSGVLGKRTYQKDFDDFYGCNNA